MNAIPLGESYCWSKQCDSLNRGEKQRQFLPYKRLSNQMITKGFRRRRPRESGGEVAVKRR
ncbi:hypothetical protein [Paraburkholderia tagetis]|uniref:Uncharacterized protein n=1 Tax=Paraburkholderia tagetis TaxID=2913261 RepID=A0A9X1UG53_9BURK|nr:hypothetical protein [Paraburkholderia tagetis]MCG5075279.1 hypothetical protein [Paraburkholderia tagetis]